jgi:DNA gyrase subunit A
MVWGQGNFGSVDGDPPAAPRYTEARLHKIADEMLKDIRKDTVDFGPNYDDSIQEPLVLPAAVPYLLINGASGIAVGMATNIPPHSLREVAEGTIAMIDDPDITVSRLMEYVTGPDFPTGGTIFGRRGIREAYETGKGRITVRGRFSVETAKSGKERIVVTEIPYMVNKANLVTRIADLVREGRIDGIADLRDESDRNGMRIVIELKKAAIPKLTLNRLFTLTALQQNFNVNSLALVDGRPRVLNLREMIHYFIKHRTEVVTRRLRYDLKKAEERAHILQGLKIALDNIDEVIALIKASKTVDAARRGLRERFGLSEIQSQAILDMRLQRLTNLETQKILDELKEVLALIDHLKDLLASETKILMVVREEVVAIAKQYGDERKTEIVPDEVEEINIEDLIKKEDMVVLISNRGFIKRVPVSAYRNQGRGGRGSSSANLVSEDFIEHLFIASTHDYILFVTSEGKAYWLKVHEIPEASRTARGQHVKSLLAISLNEEITTVVSLEDFKNDTYLFMATSRGVVKKVETSAFIHARTRGITAIRLDGGDKLVTGLLTNGHNEMVLVSKGGNALRFKEEAVRAMGRATHGVLGLRLSDNDELAGVLTVAAEEQMLLVTANGFGKRSEYDLFTPHGRGTRGQMAYRTNERSGELVGVISVREEDELVCMTSHGIAIRLKIAEIPSMGKGAHGVKVVRIEKPDFLVGVARVAND